MDRQVQLSNIAAMAAYITAGGSSAGSSSYPMRAAFEKQVVSDSFDQLRTGVTEHSRWLADNSSSQLRYYREYAAERVEMLKDAGGRFYNLGPADW